ncbi:ABC transporter permease [Candidatus Uabimicrobium sp. HlEnr_7]|uniref:ABC transporter permease n=1 Tax=Candidatus Uabimicrobium helgolandensis TaxID=3095367 RepID=UPI0035563659
MICKFEYHKLKRSHRPFYSMLSIILYLFFILFGFYTYAQTQTGGQVNFRYTFENRSYFNGLTFALYAFYFAVMMVLPIFAATEGGAQVAGETHNRTLYLMLARPLSRSQIFFSKLFVSFSYLFFLVGYLLAFALLTGLVFVGWGTLNLYPGVLQMSHVHQSLSQSEALNSFACAWVLASVALSAPLALSFLLSTWIRNPLNAVSTSIALYLILYVMSEIHFFVKLRPYFFTSYMGFWREAFREEILWGQIFQDGAKILAFTFVFLALAYRRFRLREEI